MFLDKLIETVQSIWKDILPWTIVTEGHQAGLMRLGKYLKTLDPGFHLKIPYADYIDEHFVGITTVKLEPQTVTTKDDVSVVVAAIVKYNIDDLKSYIVEIWDQHDALSDLTMGAIRTHIHNLTYNELISDPPENPVATAVRREVNRYGFKIHKITFTDIGKMKSLRLVMRNAPNLEQAKNDT